MSLPNDIITQILEQRTVFVANYNITDSDWPINKTLGVFNTMLAAEQALIEHQLNDTYIWNHLDPCKRFGFKLMNNWIDYWRCLVPNTKYSILEHVLDVYQPTDIKNITYLNFGTKLAQHIETTKMSSKDVYDLLLFWRNNISTCHAFLIKHDYFSKTCIGFKSKITPEEWHAVYTQKEPYPFGELEVIEK